MWRSFGAVGLAAALVLSYGCAQSPAPTHTSTAHRTTRAALAINAAAVLVPACPTALDPEGHPVDCHGFVTDGSPQLDDFHCVGSPFQVFVCLAARHPTFGAFLLAKTGPDPSMVPCGEMVARWYPQLAPYPWPIAEMEKIMCRESGGNPLAVNRFSGACGLFQLLSCPPGGLDGFTNIRLAYLDKYRPSGLAPWSETA